MHERDKRILVADSRSENMIRRLLEVSPILRSRRRRKALLATNGCLIRCGKDFGRN